MKFDPNQYPIINGKRAIPFSEWLPPDFKDVQAFTVGGVKRVVYYSPTYNKIIVTSTGNTIAAYKLQFWLKEVDETGTMQPTQTNAKSK